MIRLGARLLAVVVVLAVAGCASAPMHYYTLVPPADASPASSQPPSLPFELLPVGIPPQVDQPQLVVREGAQGVALLQGERWIAPLGDEVRSAVASALARDLGSQDVSGLPGNGLPTFRIKLDLRRFDSQPGRYALIEGAWSIRLLRGKQNTVIACTSRLDEPVGAGYAALVEGHQRVLARLAAQIASVARVVGSGQQAVCPAG